MRGIRKQRPPVNVRPADQPPQSLKEAGQELTGRLKGLPAEQQREVARDAFDGLEKKHLRACHLSEQRYLCIYCEVAMDKEVPARIDHWVPVKETPSSALDWSNLHLSCASPVSCDVAKGDALLNLPLPSEIKYEDHICYTRNGKIVVNPSSSLLPDQQEALTQAISTILSLNHPAQVAARVAIRDALFTRIEKKFAGRRATSEERAAEAARLLQPERLGSYVSFQIAYLNRALAPLAT